MFKQVFLHLGLDSTNKPLHKTKDYWDQYLKVSFVFCADFCEKDFQLCRGNLKQLSKDLGERYLIFL